MAAASAGARAQGMELFDPHGAFPGDSVMENQARDAEGAAPRLRAALGAGIAVAPRFPGSDRYRAHLVPAVHLAYGPVFFGIGGLGVNLYRQSRWRFGVNLMPGGERKESDDPRLNGLGDIHRTVRAGVFGVYAGPRVLARANVSTDIGGNHQGTLARFDVFGRMRGGESLVLFAGPGVTWGDRRYMQTFFGVSAEQSARSGLPEFDAHAGIASARVSAGALYRLAPRWRLLANYSLARFTGDAASSPIVENRNESFLLVSAVYFFR